MLDGLTILYKSSVDLFFYVMGSSYENELLLMSALDVLFDSLNMILKKEFEKKALMEHLDMVMMAVDEICDQGILIEHDPEVSFLTRYKKNNQRPSGCCEQSDSSELRGSSTGRADGCSCSGKTAGSNFPSANCATSTIHNPHPIIIPIAPTSYLQKSFQYLSPHPHQAKVEQGTSLLQSAKEQLKWSLLK